MYIETVYRSLSPVFKNNDFFVFPLNKNVDTTTAANTLLVINNLISIWYNNL